jgi:hypothetical protein
MLITGPLKTVNGVVVIAEQPVEESVNVKFTTPLEILVTFPELSMVAIAVLVLVHVPPVVGLKVVVDPIHKELGPVKTGFGFGSTNISKVGLVIHDAVVFNVIVKIPGPLAVTTPLLLTVPMAGLLVCQVPLSEPTKVTVDPIHISEGPEMLAEVGLLTVNTVLASEVHPVLLLVKEKVT